MRTSPSGAGWELLRPVDLPLTQYRSLWKASIAGQKLSMLQILDAICTAYEVSPSLIRSQDRCLEACVPRHHAMWIMYEQPHLSLPMIGKFMERDHTSVLHGIRSHKARVELVSREQEAA